MRITKTLLEMLSLLVLELESDEDIKTKDLHMMKYNTKAYCKSPSSTSVFKVIRAYVRISKFGLVGAYQVIQKCEEFYFTGSRIY